MTKPLALFPITHWLLNAATIVLLILAAVFAVALVAAGIASVVPGHLHIPDRIVGGMARGEALAIAIPALVWGLAACALLALVFRNTAAIVASAKTNDPFVDENARRLKLIGWLLIAQASLQPIVASILNPMAARLEAAYSRPGNTVHMDPIGSGLSPVTILTILLVFVLAQIFRRGAEMRSELEGTV